VSNIPPRPSCERKVTHTLTDVKLRALKPADSLYRVADAKGLTIEVPTAGALRWRLRYRFAGKAKMLSLGTYPDVKLPQARDRRDAARALLLEGVDPSADRQEKKTAPDIALADEAKTFRAIARDWMSKQDIAEVTANKNRWLLETFLLPDLGDRPIREITARELLITLRKIEATGKLETAKRARVKAGQVFRYAILEGLAENDPTTSLRGALKAPKQKHHAAITDPARIGELLRAIDGFSGQQVTLYALKLAPLVFVRPGELRHAEWPEIDLDRAMWRIPALRMKMKSAHLVPLSKQAIALLRELFEITGKGNFVFPGVLSSTRPISENTVNSALRRLGYPTALQSVVQLPPIDPSKLGEQLARLVKPQLDRISANRFGPCPRRTSSRSSTQDDAASPSRSPQSRPNLSLGY